MIDTRSVRWTPADSRRAVALAELDRGSFASVATLYDGSAATATSLAELVWCAEAALYLDRRGDARAWLARSDGLSESLGAVGELGDLARRAALVAVEIDFVDGALAEALEQVLLVLARAEGAKDRVALMRARYNAGRTCRR